MPRVCTPSSVCISLREMRKANKCSIISRVGNAESTIKGTYEASEASRAPREGAGSPRKTALEGGTGSETYCPGKQGTRNGRAWQAAYAHLVKSRAEIIKQPYVVSQHPEIKPDVISRGVITLRRVC